MHPDFNEKSILIGFGFFFWFAKMGLSIYACPNLNLVQIFCVIPKFLIFFSWKKLNVCTANMILFTKHVIYFKNE